MILGPIQPLDRVFMREAPTGDCRDGVTLRDVVVIYIARDGSIPIDGYSFDALTGRCLTPHAGYVAISRRPYSSTPAEVVE